MKKREDIKKYRNKITTEAILKSIIFGAIIGLAIGFILAFIFWWLLVVNGVLISVIVSSAVLVIASVLLYVFVFKPNDKQTASRMDAIGLEERVITMLELEESDSVIANKQREDTKEQLQTITPKNLKFTKLLKPLIAFVLVAGMSITMIVLLSGKIEAYTNTEPPVEELSREDQIIADLIEDLRRIVDNADVSQGLKADLHELIDNLEESIKKEDSLLVKIGKIEDTRKEILARIAAEQDQIFTIAEALQEYDTTELLGKAIESEKPEDIDNAITTMIHTLVAIGDPETKNHYLLQTADDIEAALEDSNEDNDELRQILQDLADYLRTLVVIITGEGDIPKADEMLEDELKQVGNDLKELLADQQNESETGESMSDAIQDALDQLEGKQPQESEEENEEKEDENGNQKSKEEKEDEEKEDGEGKNEDEDPDKKGDPVEAGKQVIIDGKIYYADKLSDIILELHDRIQNDTTLTAEEVAALNAFLRNIMRAIEEE